ncbi:MAG: NUDIX domain-containing protein [Nanoarchaeota archaeon]|nr:NUDIX domain-containing protein [Nanoarchaeota archaeon]
MTKKPFSPEEFKQIYSKVPRLCIDPIVRMEDGIVLSLRNGNYGWENQWHLPGGTLLYKETVEQGLKRLMKDEIGIEVKIVKVLGYKEFPSEEKERGFGWSVSLMILCDFVSGKLRPDENALEVKAFSKLPDNIVKEHAEFLEEHWDQIMDDK